MMPKRKRVDATTFTHTAYIAAKDNLQAAKGYVDVETHHGSYEWVMRVAPLYKLTPYRVKITVEVERLEDDTND
jgi:hypothetical protein